jgi:hypothetical protein
MRLALDCNCSGATAFQFLGACRTRRLLRIHGGYVFALLATAAADYLATIACHFELTTSLCMLQHKDAPDSMSDAITLMGLSGLMPSPNV